MKINFDVGFDKEKGIVGVGAIGRDDYGLFKFVVFTFYVV